MNVSKSITSTIFIIFNAIQTLYFQRTHPTKLEPTLTVGICHVCCADCSTPEFPLMNMPDFVILSTKQVNYNVKPGTDTNLHGNLRLSPLLRKYLNDIRNLFFYPVPVKREYLL